MNHASSRQIWEDNGTFELDPAESTVLRLRKAIQERADRKQGKVTSEEGKKAINAKYMKELRMQLKEERKERLAALKCVKEVEADLSEQRAMDQALKSLVRENGLDPY